MHSMNHALMAKLGWRLAMEKENLWAKVLTRKYFIRDIGIQKLIKKNGSSNILRGLAEASDTLLKGGNARIYNSRETLF